MAKSAIYFSIALCLCTKVLAQDILIYHPRKGDKIKLYDNKKQIFDGKKMRLRQGEQFAVRILNPNPLFYKYEVKYDEQEDEVESKIITDALTVLNGILATRAGASNLDKTYNQYSGAINNLLEDIQAAQKLINDSEVPELEISALNGERNGGLKFATDQILGKVQPGVRLQLSTAKYRFLSPTLNKDLDELLNAIDGLDQISKRSLDALNKSIVQQVNGIKEKMLNVETEIDSKFTVTSKTTKVVLTILPIDPDNHDLSRLTVDQIEIATIVPYYQRAVLELVPVGNFLFAGDVKEFYVEDDVFKSRTKTKTTFAPGVVLNANVASFGYRKEMSAGLGLGYKLAKSEDAIDNLYFSALFSYKEFLRVGLGFGFAAYPNSLKDGLQEGDSMPSNITNIADLIEYKDKPTMFLTLSFAGLSLTSKK